MENRRIIYRHLLIALLTAIVFYISMKPLLNVPEDALLTDVIVSGIILSALLLLLNITAQYSHFSSLPFNRQIVNYSALAILFVVCWVGAEYLILYIILSEQDWLVFYSAIPIRITIALLVYVSAVFRYNRTYDVQETPESIEIEEVQPIQENQEIVERIAVKNGSKIDVILVSEIISLQAEGDYVMIHSVKGKYLKEQTMKSFETCLPSDKFVRVHRSSIVNIDFIAQIELYDKQSQLLKLKNGSQIKISLSGYKALKKTLAL